MLIYHLCVSFIVPEYQSWPWLMIIIIIQAFVRRTMSASELNLRRRKLYMRSPQYAPPPCKLTFDLESGVRVTWANSVSILVFLGVCSRLRPDVRDRQTSDAHHRSMPLTLGAGS